MSYQVKKDVGVTKLPNGYRFRVWAPFAKSVSLSDAVHGSELTPMVAEKDGYWSVDVAGLEPGVTYRYVIDTGTEQLWKNDPRARQMTASENGMSIVTDRDFDWGDDAYSPPAKAEQVIYEMHVGTFNRPDPSTGGTFASAAEKLDYLKDLGINMIELMPVTSMLFGDGWGYGPTQQFSVETSYGGRRQLLEFIKAAHEKQIGVILDVVYNHFAETELWRYDGWGEGDYGGIYFFQDERGKTPWGGRPDYGRPEVRQYFLDNVAMWFSEYHIDGMRLDSTIYMRNTLGLNDDPAHDIAEAWLLMSDITREAHKIKPGAIMIAEDCATNPFVTKKQSDGGAGFDSQWDIGTPIVLREALGLEKNAWQSIAGVKYEILHNYNGDPFERVVYSDSHDSAANGSVRLNEAVSPGNAESEDARRRVLVANAFALTIAGIPMLLQGQEFLQQGSFNDWADLEWSKTDQFAGIVQAHKDLIALRLNKGGVTAGLLGSKTAIFHENNDNCVIGYHRYDNGGTNDDVLVLINFSNQFFKHYNVTLPFAGTWKVRFNSSWKGYSHDFPGVELDELVAKDEKSLETSLHLPPYGVFIFSLA